MQHEITKEIPLLDAQGNLTEAGYAKRLLPVYNRKNVKGGFARLKEWDYYYIGNDRFGVALTIADNSYMGLDSISFLSFEKTPWQITKSPMRIFPMGRTNLPPTSKLGVSAVSGKDYGLMFRVREDKRCISAHMENFKDGQPIHINVDLTAEPEESMVICTPFEKTGHFYYNQKINCMYWGSASGLVDGADFGFNIGYGFGDTSAASENMLFYKGKAHKLSQVTFEIPMKDGKEDYLKPWKFTSDDGRFEMDFAPVLDRAACTDVKLIKSDQHQVFGRFTGKAVLDDGTVLEVRDLMGFAEKVENKW